MRISLCTTCMNRKEHLRITLPANLSAAASFPGAEFILLNYNSTDGLHEWVRSNLLPEIRSGRIVYVHERTAPTFRMSHAKNMAARLATGDVICNVDADNICGIGFVQLLDRLFSEGRYIFCLRGRNIGGRVAVRREDFYALGGYDETFEGWGYEDLDFRCRAIALGLTPVGSYNPRFRRAIQHADRQRYEHLDVPEDMLAVNRDRGRRNSSKGNMTANGGVFGAGTVYINLSDDPVIL